MVRLLDRVRRLQGDNKSIPPVSEWKLSSDSKFVHYCDNETIQGVEFHEAPDVGEKLLIGDFSSNILSKPVDVFKYGVIYAGAGQQHISCVGSSSSSKMAPARRPAR
jgi:phosphoserine aminotransferase